MRVITAFLIALSVTLGLPAQDLEVNFYEGIDLYEGIDEKFYSGSNFGVKNPIYSAYPVSGMIRHNRVDGLFLGYQEEKMDWNNANFLGIENVDLHGLIGYSVAQDQLQYSIGAEKSIGTDRKWLLFGGDLHNTTSTEDYWRTGIYENSLTSFATGFDYHDYYNADGYGFYAIIKPVRFLEFGASYNVDEFSSLEVNTDFSVISKYSSFRPNPAIHSDLEQINQQSLTLGLTINPRTVNRHSSVWSTVSAKAEIADLGGTENDFFYNKYQVEAKSYFRLDHTTLFKWRLMAGSITGEAPDFKNFALGGIGSMRALGFKSLTGNLMVLSNLEVELGKSTSYRDGWPDLSSFYISLFLDSGTSMFNQSYLATTNPLSDFDLSFSELSHNAGIGLGFGMFRAEVAKPIAGSEGRTSFWIRFNPTF
ncbi:MAG: hypothetical protein JJ953_10270 [Gracilimonas sp.]|uniref:BamA/TamA family outer membrane protein n=1 Tax=Gracilimonas TaxID=649462 RepID=UPI001AFE1BD6|nr:BamA/TamA family outer membrane protein [Gracilimonas sp.]MBO6586479.1 hypothetical protein [Gracilimonas sp.]MBO6615136.1 hypothetical protein [Gracilimonas sp.]